MKLNGTILHKLNLLLITIGIVFLPGLLLAENNERKNDCMDKAIKRIIEIRSLPEIPYLQTMDGQVVLLHKFYAKCSKLYPKCNMFEKFYYLTNEIREVASRTKTGVKKHKIRSYYNCLSAFCQERFDSKKIHRLVKRTCF